MGSGTEIGGADSLFAVGFLILKKLEALAG
jgi:hypothetical protein